MSMYEQLWNTYGFDRLIEIDRLKIEDPDFICGFYRKCGECPLAIRYRDKNGIERLICADVASRKRVEDILRTGGKFVTKKDR